MAAKIANLAPSWKAKWLQNGGPNPKKSMLKKIDVENPNPRHVFSIDFGRVRTLFWKRFGRFFGPKMHAKSDVKKSVRQANSIGKTNTKSMSALLQQRVFRAKIN